MTLTPFLFSNRHEAYRYAKKHYPTKFPTRAGGYSLSWIIDWLAKRERERLRLTFGAAGKDPVVSPWSINLHFDVRKGRYTLTGLNRIANAIVYKYFGKNHNVKHVGTEYNPPDWIPDLGFGDATFEDREYVLRFAKQPDGTWSSELL